MTLNISSRFLFQRFIFACRVNGSRGCLGRYHSRPLIKWRTVHTGRPSAGCEMVKLVIDTDGVGDDIRAITIALTRPNVEVLAFTTVKGCVGARQAALNVLRVQRAVNLPSHIPIYVGAEEPILTFESKSDESFFFGRDGLSDSSLTTNPKVKEGDETLFEKEAAAIGLINIFKEHDDLTLVAIGPLTNIALAMKLDPSFKSKPRRIVIMGGNYLGIGNVHSNSSAEYNFHGDPEAAHIVLSEMEAPITIIPWECYYIEGPKYQKVLDFCAHTQYDTPLSKFIAAATERGRATAELHGKQFAFCDEIAIAVAIDPVEVIVKQRELRGSVELSGRYSRGQVVLDWTSELWNVEEETKHLENKLDLSRRPLTFVTDYNVHIIDAWLHEACKRSTKISTF